MFLDTALVGKPSMVQAEAALPLVVSDRSLLTDKLGDSRLQPGLVRAWYVLVAGMEMEEFAGLDQAPVVVFAAGGASESVFAPAACLSRFQQACSAPYFSENPRRPGVRGLLML